MNITLRRVGEQDFPLLRRWLREPHVKRWWNHETTAEAVARDFGPAARGEEPSEDLLAFLEDRPVGLVQRSRLCDYPDYLAELAAVVPVPDGAMTVDYLIGDPRLTGRGIGTAVIRSVIGRTWVEHPGAPCVLVPVVAANRPSWRALERAGLRRVGVGDLEPDNPVDDRTHYLYRVDRPAAGT
ncbi:acetyltransferase [Streptomyces pactum]|uniref:Acetyltransferase n=1 Tax=Streptomyces pactum TaxID=68249 RepID=A0ABS0NUD6_9ACTN|nr:GNAT family N-acetyltransferase [Streptomyces pactum]MBH5338746.1 acetyltransferase [Streptomyces pactum]